MKNSTYKITIPEPCHEDWNAMLPDAKGKFCNSCNKSVIDFSNKTDLEIRDILLAHKDQQVCGHFKKTQINRPLNIRVDFNDLPKNMSSTKTFALALFLVFGTVLFSCTDHKNKPVDGIEIVNSKPENTITGEPIAPIQSIDTETIAPIKKQNLEPTIDFNERHVNGGISMREIPTIDETPLIEIDSNRVVSIMGQMTIFIPQKDSTEISFSDSSKTIDPKENLSNTLLYKQTDFTVYPNPSNSEFTIKYVVSKRADVRIDIYDLNGALLKTIVNIQNQYEGKYQIPVNVNELSNGVYLVNLINNGKLTTQRLVLAK